MSIQRINPGKRMSEAVIHGDTVYVSGQVAEKTIGQGVKAQTAEVLSFVDEALKSAGTDKSKLLSATIVLSDIRTFAEMNEAWEAWVSPGNTPARATIEAKLAGPQYLVEVIVIAAK
jgi:enamine deaminase RidA (YjgF/YER057c/UK114 family)